MKKLILIPFLFFCFVSFGQRVVDIDSIHVPSGSDTTLEHLFWNYDNSWGIEVSSYNVDGVDTLYIYCTSEVDSAELGLIFIDTNLDGVNDNPWTLANTDENRLLIYGEFWPCRYIVYRLAKGTSTAGLTRFIVETRR